MAVYAYHYFVPAYYAAQMARQIPPAMEQFQEAPSLEIGT